MEKPITIEEEEEAFKTNAAMETQSSGSNRKGAFMTNAASETQSDGSDKKRRKRCRNICLCVTVVFILIFVVLLILTLTLFKPKRPVTTVDSVTVDRLRASMDVLNLKALLNLTIHVDVSLKNPNRFGFRYNPSSALLNYRGELIGEAPLPAGRIDSQQTQNLNLTVTLMADRLLSESQLLSDVMAGEIPLNTFVKVSGKVSVLNMFKFKVQSSSSCDLIISVSNRNVTRQECTYTTKL